MEKEKKELSVLMAIKIEGKEGRIIEIEKILNNLVRYNKGFYKNYRQRFFLEKIIEEKSIPFSGFEYEEEVKEKISELLKDTDRFMIYQRYRWNDHSYFLNIFILDDSGVRLKLIASWTWKKIKITPLRYDPGRHNRMYRWSREKNVGLNEEDKILKFNKISIKYERCTHER